jgi:catechol 2,3-dioxygenase-like lactoylglutathione lyase family enzyme
MTEVGQDVRYEERTGAVLFAGNLDRIAAFYSALLGLVEAGRDKDHILLESPGFQLVVHRIPHKEAPTAEASDAPTRRASAPFKPVFFVPDFARLRSVAGSLGGSIEPADREWSFNGVPVCDGIDPEGNVIQFRLQRG